MQLNAQFTNALAYTSAIVALGWGVMSSMDSGDWGWFARSGSVVVVIGVLLTSSQIFEHNRKLRHRRSNFDHEIKHGRPHRSDHDWAGDDGMKSLARSRSLEEDTWDIEAHGFYLLIAGTLIWGFGDLLG